MARNEILDEIHAAREALLAQHGGDVHAYIEAARKRALASGRLIAPPKQRTIRCTRAAKSADLPVENQSSPPGDR
jgi:ethanolamine utilization microcompartment shell protein EutL